MLELVAAIIGIVTGVWFVVEKIVPAVRRRHAKQTLPEFAPGRWRSTGGSNELVIANDLTWKWKSTHQGRWHGSGRGDVVEGYLVLHGSREGQDPLGRPVPRYPLTITLQRQRDRLEGSIQAILKTDVIYVRDESARAE